MDGENENQKTTQTALVILTLIAAGEADHPVVKQALRRLLEELDGHKFRQESFSEQEVATILPFRKLSPKRLTTQSDEMPRFRIFDPEADKAKTVAVSCSSPPLSSLLSPSSPQLRIFPGLW